MKHECECKFMCLTRFEKDVFEHEHKLGCIFLDMTEGTLIRIKEVIDNRTQNNYKCVLHVNIDLIFDGDIVVLDDIIEDELKNIIELSLWILSIYYKFNLDEVEKYKNRISWDVYSNNRHIGEEILEKYNDQIVWRRFARFNKFSRELYHKFSHELNECSELINSNPHLDFYLAYKPLREVDVEDLCIVCYEPTKYLTFCNHHICEKCFEGCLKINHQCPYCRQFINVEVIDKADVLTYEVI